MDDWVQLSEIVRNLGLIVVAGIGIWLAYGRVTAANRQAEASLRQAELARRDHVAELFNRAVGQLCSEQLEVRLGAVYTLRQILQDFPDLSVAVLELLGAYIRESGTDYGDASPPADIREIVRILRSALEIDRDNQRGIEESR